MILDVIKVENDTKDKTVLFIFFIFTNHILIFTFPFYTPTHIYIIDFIPLWEKNVFSGYTQQM